MLVDDVGDDAGVARLTLKGAVRHHNQMRVNMILGRA